MVTKEKPMSYNIKELPLTERPYEKLEKYGPAALTDAELLAIIIRTGSRKEASTLLASRILSLDQRGLAAIHILDTNQLMSINGVGRVKALQLKALSEISKRMAKSTSIEKLCINSPSSIAKIYMEEMRYHEREHFKVIFLNTKNAIIGDEDISIGTVNASLVDPREIFKMALMYKAVHLILMHNHPSGIPTPSQNDIDVTKRMVKAGHVLGIEILDHIIIGDGNYISLKEQSLGF